MDSIDLIDALPVTCHGIDSPRRHNAALPDVSANPDVPMTELPSVGDEFLGFDLLAELGKGAFGKVFLAKQGQLAGRFVALKVARGLFNESQTLAQLQHTHIMPIYSYHNGHPFQAVCMPYLGSATLAHLLAYIRSHANLPSSGKELLSTLADRTKKLPACREESSTGQTTICSGSDRSDASGNVLPQIPIIAPILHGMSYVDSVLWFAVRLADGLAHAHSHGIVHRDLKPANILITDDGRPMLLDFNLAHDTHQHESAEDVSIGGTLPYMAPEHLAAFCGVKASVDARSDIYSLGVILFELLTGAAPFPTYSKLPMRETIERMIVDRDQGAPPLGSLNSMVSPAVEAIIQRCLKVDQSERYQTAQQLKEDLDRQLENRPLRYAGNSSLLERCQKFRRRHPLLTSMTSVCAVAAVVVASLAGLLVVGENRRARLESQATYSRFQDDSRSAYFLLSARSDKVKLDEGERIGRATLGYYHVLDKPDWRASAMITRLSQEEQNHLQAEVGQILVLLAQSQQVAGQREIDDNRRAEKYQAGLHFCSLAGTCFPEGNIPQALWKQQGELHRRLGEREQAEKCFAHASKAELKTVQDRYLTARSLAEEGKFREALPLLREAVRLSPQDFNLHFLQGVCHDYLGQNSEAIGCYRACITLRPRFYGAYYNRGLAYLRQQDFESAREDFDHAIRLHPEFTEAYLSRASAFEGQKKYALASADLTEALNRGYAPTRVYFLRAAVRQQAGDREGAGKDRAEGMRLEPTDEDGWIARGLAFLPGEPKQALHSFEKAIEANPRSLPALQNKAHVLGKYFKRTEDAVAALDKAVELYPDDSRPRAGRGVYLGRLGKRAAALKDAEHALLLDTSPANLYQVAGIYALTSRQEGNDRHEALNLLSAALKKGFGFDYLEIDRDLDPLRESSAFRRVVEGARALQVATPRKTS